MPSAVVDPARVKFPPVCPHCGQPADTTRRIVAHGPLDMVVGEYGGSFGIEIPVCRASARRRGWYGTAELIAEMLLILTNKLTTGLKNHELDREILRQEGAARARGAGQRVSSAGPDSRAGL